MLVYGNPNSKHLFIQIVDEHDLKDMPKQINYIAQHISHDDWCILAIQITDWNNALSPWYAESLFKKDDFNGNADITIKYLLENVIPNFTKKYSVMNRHYYLCGYSLAGLFSLYTGYQSNFFQAVIAVSPSVWYPNWLEYLKNNVFKSEMVYLSIGDQEANTKHKILKTVEDNIKIQYNELIATKKYFEYNEGNHFNDTGKRVAKGIVWVLNIINEVIL